MDTMANEGRTLKAPPADLGTGLGAGLAALMDELAHGVVLATLEGKVLHANQAAHNELSRRRTLLEVDGHLKGRTADGTRLLHERLARLADGKRSLLEVPAEGGSTLTLALVPLRASLAEPVRAAILFSRAAVCDSLMLCFFARTYRLTATEEHVLGILCEGFSAPEVASRMDIAVSTVRSHIRSLCAKTRSGGVRELVSRIAVLPPMAPPIWHEPMH